MQFEWFQLWTFPVILLCYYEYELIITRKLAQKPQPLVGRGSVLIPQFVLNIIFALRGAAVVGRGYEKVIQYVCHVEVYTYEFSSGIVPFS